MNKITTFSNLLSLFEDAIKARGHENIQSPFAGTSFGSTKLSAPTSTAAGKSFVATVELAGFTREQVSISADKRNITVTAKRKAGTTDIVRSSAFNLPLAYDKTKAAAKLENGLLTITFPLKQEAVAAAISIPVG